MKCSILINNYNYSKFVRECLESAVAQTYGDLEIIIVDDGSTDDSKEVISAIAEASPRPIKTIFKENGGQGSAMNEGYANCSGEIVFFLDADDFLAPDCVERVVGIWNCNMSRVYFNLQFVDEDSEHIAGVFQDSVPMPRGDLREKAATEGLFIGTPTSGNAWSRVFLADVMPMPELEWKFYSDSYLLAQATLAGHTGRIDDPIGFYRVHKQNGSGHTQNGRLSERAMRNTRTLRGRIDSLAESYASAKGIKYEKNVIKRRFGHAQFEFLLIRFFGQPEEDQSHWSALANALKRMQADKRLPMWKKPIIGIWMASIAILPSRIAEYLAVLGYRNGLLVDANKHIHSS